MLAENRVRSSRDLYDGKRTRERARVGRREGEERAGERKEIETLSEEREREREKGRERERERL